MIHRSSEQSFGIDARISAMCGRSPCGHTFLHDPAPFQGRVCCGGFPANSKRHPLPLVGTATQVGRSSIRWVVSCTEKRLLRLVHFYCVPCIGSQCCRTERKNSG